MEEINLEVSYQDYERVAKEKGFEEGAVDFFESWIANKPADEQRRSRLRFYTLGPKIFWAMVEDSNIRRSE